MPRVGIPIVQIVRAGAAPVAEVASDVANNHELASNDGRCFIVARNTDTVARSLTVLTPATSDGFTIEDLVVSIPPLTKAALTTALAGTDNDLTFTADTGGTDGNNIRIRYLVAGNNTPLTVSLSGTDITVNVATDGAGVATSTAAQVKTALDGNGSIAALIDTANAPGNDGTGIVATLAFTNLTGGDDGVRYIGPFTLTTTFNQTDGKVYVDVANANVLKLRAYRL